MIFDDYLLLFELFGNIFGGRICDFDLSFRE